ncbi:MAG: NHL repeat-containing protein [Planctomycetota bacterium]
MTLMAAVLAAELPAQLESSIWVSDDINTQIYNIALDGTLLSDFHSGSISGLALGIGARDESIWATKEGSNLIVRFDDEGNTISSFSGTEYDVDAKAPEGVAVDVIDGSLWIADDFTNRIYNVEKDGSLISSFSTTAYDLAAYSPQDIATDPTDGTLWLTDNGTESVYNVTREGALVSSFHVDNFEPAAKNLQGICVNPTDRSIWVTDRATHALYNVSRTGTLLKTIDATVFGSSNPTGIGFHVPKPPTLPGLIADLAEGVEDGQIDEGPADRIANMVKTVMKLQKDDFLHAAASHLLVFHTTVGMLSGSLIDEALATSLQVKSEYLLEGMLES